ncbi:cyclic nucleotide-binding domain-containing protein [Sphingopyxis sp. XHP0097]|uniref:Cyclic nucleotide-binding domain-containing protein n=1 Tax=Sphingopyxis jiangsuensis TaxID=2871171 RepID=A0ABS7MH71_9SPHN|nr:MULTISPECIES: cyclic nucleotide-binding domain-containing protein [Sphingopyxis]MBL0768533.1 cyclic nucleotide-binding domain-containing protein [Sphingopyxis lutea]MBY4638377.1 cyclic nucleotide-binding domain-containing protein [Sphingopyxis jiangsuensis]
MRKALYILGDLDDADILWLARHGNVRSLTPGSQLIRAGQPIGELFFVTDGIFDVTNAAGTAIAELSLGDVVGEMSFVEKALPSATVTARGAARVLAVPRAAILAAFAEDSGFAARFYRALAVFLSDRLRTLSAPAGSQAELDEGLLDTISEAGDRFVRLIAILEGRIS